MGPLHNNSLDLFVLKAFIDLGSEINQELNIHKYPTASGFRLIVANGTSITQITYNETFIVECSASVTKPVVPNGVEYGTACFNNYCLAVSKHAISTVDASCNVGATFNSTGDFIIHQRPVFIDSIDDTETDIYIMVESGSEAAIAHFSISEGSGDVMTNEILIDDVWDDLQVSSLIAADIGDGGFPELITVGHDDKILTSNELYAFKAISTDGNIAWEDADLRFCRQAGFGSTNVSYFQPVLMTHPLGALSSTFGYNVVCGACIPEDNPNVQGTQGQLIAGCFDITTGQALIANSCSVSGTGATCGLGNYGGLNASTFKPLPNMVSGNLDKSTNSHELLIGNVLLDSSFNILQTFGTQRYVFSSVGTLINKQIVDTEIDGRY